MSEPVLASTPGRCKCCGAEYIRGDLIVYDSTVSGWVLVEHLSAGAK